MSLLLILLQDAPDFSVKPRIDGLEAVGHVFMYSWFADPEFNSRTAHGIFAFHDVFSELDGSFLDDSFQKKDPPFVVTILLSIYEREGSHMLTEGKMKKIHFFANKKYNISCFFASGVVWYKRDFIEHEKVCKNSDEVKIFIADSAAVFGSVKAILLFLLGGEF